MPACRQISTSVTKFERTNVVLPELDGASVAQIGQRLLGFFAIGEPDPIFRNT